MWRGTSGFYETDQSNLVERNERKEGSRPAWFACTTPWSTRAFRTPVAEANQGVKEGGSRRPSGGRRGLRTLAARVRAVVDVDVAADVVADHRMILGHVAGVPVSAVGRGVTVRAHRNSFRVRGFASSGRGFRLVSAVRYIRTISMKGSI